MNIAFFLIPKKEVAYLTDEQTLRQGLEKMRHHRYTAIPVIDAEGKYITTISEGDFLDFILSYEKEGAPLEKIPVQHLEGAKIKDLLHTDRNPPFTINAGVRELISRGIEQNFIPVVDDSGSFIGIVTRRDIMRYLIENTSLNGNSNTPE